MRYKLYYPTVRSKPHIIEVNDRGERMRYIAKFYSADDAEKFIDAMNSTEITRNEVSRDWAAFPISNVELAAYRCYLGESLDRLCELFEDMPIDEVERYRKAHAPRETQDAER